MINQMKKATRCKDYIIIKIVSGYFSNHSRTLDSRSQKSEYKQHFQGLLCVHCDSIDYYSFEAKFIYMCTHFCYIVTKN